MSPARCLSAALAAVGLGTGLGACTAEPPLLELPTVVRRAQEVRLEADGSLLPVALGAGRVLGLCAEVPASVDTSRWQVRLSFGGVTAEEGFAPPAARMGPTLCFDAALPAELAGGSELELCAEGVDRFDGTRFRLPCRRLRYEAEMAAYQGLLDELGAVLEVRPGLSFETFLGRLDTLAGRSRAAGLPLFELRFLLVSVHFLLNEGTPEATAEAERRLAELPAWLERPEVSYRGGQAALQQARYHLAAGDLLAAWRRLEHAERRFRRIADPQRLSVVLRQADLKARLGSVREGLSSLRAALEECRRLECPATHLALGRLQLGWLTALDTEADAGELAAAHSELEAGLETLSAAEDPLELANQRINLAYLEVRRGLDPSARLAAARELLAAAEVEEERRARLADWADLVAGLARLEGDPAGAAETCRALAWRADPVLAPCAWSCLGQALRRLGEPAAAEAAFARALESHEAGDPGVEGLGVPLGPSQRADDFARAARLAVERGSAARAWDLLERLDAHTAAESQRRRCREQASEPAVVERWRQIDTESRRLLGELAALERPASLERAREVEPLRRSLAERVRELWREWPGCAPMAPPAAAEPGYRAVAVDGEVLLLARDGAGEVTLERRTAFETAELRRRLAAVGHALETRDPDEAAWRDLLEPFAEALLPRAPCRGDGVSTFALHGALQAVPLAALPLPAAEAGAERRWLADCAVVALRPAASTAAPAPPGPPLLVVDPLGDLAGGSALVGFYRQRFPSARLLAGEVATRDAFRRALADAGWLHLDAHGRYESAFPELSALELADGPLSFVELATLPVAARFANLSGCRTGSWPPTADSGRYGLGGLLARLGVGWVVASRADLGDAVARAYNRSFYAAIADGLGVPEAHAAGLRAARRGRPVTAWAALVLLRSARAAAGAEGASGVAAHSRSLEEVRDARDRS